MPAGFVPPPAATFTGYRPMQTEIAYVPDAILELQGIPNWGLIFGMTAPAAPLVAGRLSVAMQWTDLYAESEAWFNYVKSQEGLAWKDALEVTDTLKVPLQCATATNPALLKQYPALQRLLGAQKVVAKKAVTTKANKKAAAASTAAAASAQVALGGAAATAAAVPAGAQIASAPAATPVRVVTVSG